jgi:hypothetical protein
MNNEQVIITKEKTILSPEEIHKLAIAPLPKFNIVTPQKAYASYGPYRANDQVRLTSE